MSGRSRSTGDETPPATGQAPEAPLAIEGEYAVLLHEWAGENAWRIDGGGERRPAAELMGGFVHQMNQAGRRADYPSNYRRDWQAFLAG